MQKVSLGVVCALCVLLGLGMFFQSRSIGALSERIEQLERLGNPELASSEKVALKDARGERQRRDPTMQAGAFAQKAVGKKRVTQLRQDLAERVAENEEDTQQVLTALKKDPEAAAAIVQNERAQEIVTDLVREQLQEEREGRFQRRQQRAFERIDERVEDFAAKFALDGPAREQMGSILKGERAEISTFWQQAREGNITRGEAHEKMREVHSTTDQNVQAILDDDQFAAYQEDREANRHHRPPPKKEKKEAE